MDEIQWQSPSGLRQAASTLLKLTQGSEQSKHPLVELYAKGPYGSGKGLARDLEDIVKMAETAQEVGVKEMTLFYGW